MFILRDLLPPLQTAFSPTPLGRERAQWFLSTLLAVVEPFTSSMTSNISSPLLTTLFGLSLVDDGSIPSWPRRPCPWERLWRVLWDLIPARLSDGRLVLALDDFINPKVGREIFGCEAIFDHAAKSNQSRYTLGRRMWSRWGCSNRSRAVGPACPWAFRFYPAEESNTRRNARDTSRETAQGGAVSLGTGAGGRQDRLRASFPLFRRTGAGRERQLVWQQRLVPAGARGAWLAVSSALATAGHLHAL